ncbi:MAG: hypothetical protein J6C91_00595, partial [Muribaculaceae bacterium]|nr:hypothetical protein [Muribaculaceae bacterium]
MTLFADCGATSSRWILTDSGRTLSDVRSLPLNAATMNEDAMRHAVGTALDSLSGNIAPGTAIRVYAAGARDNYAVRFAEILADMMPLAGKIDVKSDMVLTAEATLGNKPGVACILGTGSNTCLWDGERIVKQVPSLGYILGDEASGADIGRTLVREYLRGNLNREIHKEIHRTFPELNVESAIRHVYRESGANTWLATFAKFVIDHKDDADMKRIISDALSNFMNHQACAGTYGETDLIGFSGGIAYALRGEIEAMLTAYGVSSAVIVADP